MSKIKSVFLHYDGFVKSGKRWTYLGKFETIKEADEAGATKFKPRFLRTKR
tara:strand:- start:41 stop:193 length:153 start_codon:yes stop_codon:yes gene_type:complete